MKINALRKTYDGRCVLDFPGLELERGKVYAVIGANGSGKSTLGRILAGLEFADGKKTPLDPKVSIGYMLQKNYAFQLSVLDNVLLNGKKSADKKQKAESLLTTVGLAHLAKEKAHRLSGGETARMAVARILMGDYDVLILDEPTAAMDVAATLTIEQLVVDYCREHNCVVILITHALKQAMRIADIALYLQEGKLLEYGNALEVLSTPQKKETKQFIDFYSL